MAIGPPGQLNKQTVSISPLPGEHRFRRCPLTIDDYPSKTLLTFRAGLNMVTLHLNRSAFEYRCIFPGSGLEPGWLSLRFLSGCLPWLRWPRTTPTKPINLTVTFAPGGTLDVSSRILAGFGGQEMQKG
jgi:hypothetical protein